MQPDMTSGSHVERPVERSIAMKEFMEKMTSLMMDRTSPEEKHEMMSGMMERFCDNMTADDKQNMMEAMMPNMMQGANMMDMMPKMMMGMMGGEHEAGCQEMMAKMTEEGQGMETSGMPQMMTEMMPHCLAMMLPQVAKDKQKAFTLQMVEALMEHSCADMSEAEKHQFVAEVMEKVQAAEAVS